MHTKGVLATYLNEIVETHSYMWWDNKINKGVHALTCEQGNEAAYYLGRFIHEGLWQLIDCFAGWLSAAKALHGQNVLSHLLQLLHYLTRRPMQPLVSHNMLQWVSTISSKAFGSWQSVSETVYQLLKAFVAKISWIIDHVGSQAESQWRGVKSSKLPYGVKTNRQNLIRHLSVVPSCIEITNINGQWDQVKLENKPANLCTADTFWYQVKLRNKPLICTWQTCSGVDRCIHFTWLHYFLVMV